jgi:hypothetical protein
MLPNGSILVIGGELGTNDVNQANLEILPRPGGPNAGDTVVDLPWLEDENKLESYPFVFVLPSGHLFVGKCRLLFFLTTELTLVGSCIPVRTHPRSDYL